MNKIINEYLNEIKINLDNLNSRTIVNSKGLPDEEKEEHKLNLSSILISIKKLINNIENINDDKEIDIEKLFEKYASYIRQTKYEFVQCEISKVMLHSRSEEYFDAKKRGRLSNIKYLHKLCNIKVRNKFKLSEEMLECIIIHKEVLNDKRNPCCYCLPLNRRQRRHILFKEIPEAKRYRQKIKSFSKEEIKKFYIIKYLDELLIFFTDYIEKDLFSFKLIHIEIMEKLLYNLKYLYK